MSGSLTSRDRKELSKYLQYYRSNMRTFGKGCSRGRFLEKIKYDSVKDCYRGLFSIYPGITYSFRSSKFAPKNPKDHDRLLRSIIAFKEKVKRVIDTKRSKHYTKAIMKKVDAIIQRFGEELREVQMLLVQGSRTITRKELLEKERMLKFRIGLHSKDMETHKTDLIEKKKVYCSAVYAMIDFEIKF